MLGNFYCQGREIDAAIIQKNSITIIDFKNYGGQIRFFENGPWYTDQGAEIRGGSDINPFIQIRKNRRALHEFLQKLRFPSHYQPHWNHTFGLVIFHQSIAFDECQIPHNLATWFHVVEIDHAAERVSQITAGQMNLTDRDMDAIVSALAIALYVPAGSPRKAASPQQDRSDPGELPEVFQSTIAQIRAFLNSDERLLVVISMIATGLDVMLESISAAAIEQGRNCSILGPNRRIANQYGVEARSIYTAIYSGNPKLKHNQFVFDLAPNHDTENHLYVLGDAYLVSDTPFETDRLRYGSGQLLGDLLNFINVTLSLHQFVGLLVYSHNCLNLLHVQS
ncbi:hypothetical protein LEP3755_66680 (plasmid) [Leptolyngbya sp. NIES-3755]|nr:hypothetical protein LEP3755_66680 [Leptolyngbya sp. NIES-3755]